MSQTLREPTVGEHFTGKPPAVREIYDRLLTAARRIGPVQEEPKKTSIHLVRSSAFAGIEVRRDYLLLNLKSDSPIESPRVTKAEQLSARRYHQKVRLSSPEEVDPELQGWLAKAYELSG
ncbi:MAG TPA: DUF5655 domain-containing protein [Thermoanaerobaculia bacterium]|nr:DUF5655 domain-containing protein [Thermoanaerobaculia bacterium]